MTDTGTLAKEYLILYVPNWKELCQQGPPISLYITKEMQFKSNKYK